MDIYILDIHNHKERWAFNTPDVPPTRPAAQSHPSSLGLGGWLYFPGGRCGLLSPSRSP